MSKKGNKYLVDLDDEDEVIIKGIILGGFSWCYTFFEFFLLRIGTMQNQRHFFRLTNMVSEPDDAADTTRWRFELFFLEVTWLLE